MVYLPTLWLTNQVSWTEIQYTHQNKYHKGLHQKMLFLRHNLNISGGVYSKNSDTPKPTWDLRLMLMHVHSTMIIDGISKLA